MKLKLTYGKRHFNKPVSGFFAFNWRIGILNVIINATLVKIWRVPWLFSVACIGYKCCHTDIMISFWIDSRFTANHWFQSRAVTLDSWLKQL